MMRSELVLPPINIASFASIHRHCVPQQLPATFCVPSRASPSFFIGMPAPPPTQQKAATREPPQLKTITPRLAPTQLAGIRPTGEGVVTLFPRRKAGQTRPGGGRGPVVVSLEMLEQFYGVPLHVAAKKLGICQTAIKKVCRKLGIKKWPYKELRLPNLMDSDEADDASETGYSKGSGSSSPKNVTQPVEDTISAARAKLEADKFAADKDEDLQDAVRALLNLQKLPC